MAERIMDFNVLAGKVWAQRGVQPLQKDHTILCFDPGHTTGWAYFKCTYLVACGQLDTSSIEDAVEVISNLFNSRPSLPDVVVMEDYRVYQWRAKHHVGSELLTTRVIGCIETIAVQRFVPLIVKQPAHIAKGFCTNIKLRQWGFYRKGERHACDAIRHGAYYILFGAIRKKQSPGSTVG